MRRRTIRFFEAGLVPYQEALAWQRRLHAEVVSGGEPLMVSLEHPPVYTLGRRPAPNRFRVPIAASIPVIQTDRGGEITYHGPGQAVLYVFLALDQWRLTLPQLVGFIEQAVIDFSAELGIAAQRREGWRGVFVGAKKLASVGLAVHQDVTMHGLALNVSNDLTPFRWIDPCGLPIEMCSLHTLGAVHIDRREAGRRVAEELAAYFQAELTPASLHPSVRSAGQEHE